VKVLREQGYPDDVCDAILGHADYTGVSRASLMAKILYAVDELCGFLIACALVRPSKSLQDLRVKSVKKKLKDKGFARAVNREEVRRGAEEADLSIDDHIEFVIEALRPVESSLGLGSV
jgi:predicted hydrolase (HD superfamily)